jgi:hypothetical protein
MAIQIVSGANSAYPYRLLPHVGQKWRSIQRPDSDVRRHSELVPPIVRTADFGQ